jgi:hypothetical protein
MQAFARKAIVAGALALGTLTAQAAFAASVEQQQQAIFACKTAAGIGGEASLSTTLGAEPLVQIQAFDQVTEEDALAINACAARTVASGAVPVTVAASSPRTHTGRSVRRGYTVPAANFLRSPLCPANFYGMYRGTLYCFRPN